MPVDFSVEMWPCAGEEFSELGYRVMRCAFESQNELGRLADETIYQVDVANWLEELSKPSPNPTKEIFLPKIFLPKR